MTKVLVFAVAALMLAGCSKLVVVHVPSVKEDVSGAKSVIGNENTSSANKKKMEGVYYVLPKTVVRVGVKVDHTTAKAAPFMKYAEIFAPGGQPVCTKLTCEDEGGKEGKFDKYELQQGALFATFGEPDPDRVYIVQFAGGGAIDQTVSLTWTDTGLLSTASASVTNRTTDVAMSGLKLVAGLGSKLTFGGISEEPPTEKKKEKNKYCFDRSMKNDPWIIPILENAKEALLVSNYCDMDVSARDSFSKDKDELQLKKATEAYKLKVAGLAGGRLSLLSGDSPAQQPADMLTRLDALIGQQLTELYLGSKKTGTWEGSLDVRTLAVGSEIPILRINPKKGICLDRQIAEQAPNAKPYPAEFSILENDECQQASAVNMIIGYYPDEGKQLFTKMEGIQSPEPTDERSFRYRIPAQVKAELRDDKNKTYGAGVFSVAQLGVVVSLPAQRKSKSLSYDLSFIEATGGLKSFKLGTTGMLDSTTVDALKEAGGTILDARSAARKADETSKDEVTTLTRQNTILKLKSDNCEILQKNGYPCTIQP